MLCVTTQRNLPMLRERRQTKTFCMISYFKSSKQDKQINDATNENSIYLLGELITATASALLAIIPASEVAVMFYIITLYIIYLSSTTLNFRLIYFKNSLQKTSIFCEYKWWWIILNRSRSSIKCICFKYILHTNKHPKICVNLSRLLIMSVKG